MSPLALSLRFLQAQPDSRLVALVREGHEPAFEALVRRYRKELLAYCRRLQPQPASAEDALQQTLLQAWRALKAGAEVRNARPWLYRIAHNVSVNSVRTPVAIPHEVTETAGGHDVDLLVEQRLQARAALAGVASLPTLQRQVFVSTTLDGASHEEVAAALGLSSGAVRGLMYRARAAVRAGAAAVIPAPVLGWLLRRADAQTGGSPPVAEVLAGGSGAGLAAAIAKGGAVLTLAVAGASGVVLTHNGAPDLGPSGRSATASHHANGGSGAAPAATVSAAVRASHAAASASSAGRGAHWTVTGEERGQVPLTDDHGGSGPGRTGGNDRGFGGGSSGGPGSGRGEGSSSGSDDGAGSSAASTSSGSGSDGSGSGDRGASSESSAGATTASSDGGTSGSSDGGTSGSSDGGTTGSGSANSTISGSGDGSGDVGSGSSGSDGSTADVSSGSGETGGGGSSNGSGELTSASH